MLPRLRERLFYWYIRIRYWGQREVILPGSLANPNRPELILFRAMSRAEKRAGDGMPDNFRITPQNILDNSDYWGDEFEGPSANMYESYSPSHKLDGAEMWSAIAEYVKTLPPTPLEVRKVNPKQPIPLGELKWTVNFRLLSPTEIECEYNAPPTPPSQPLR